MGTSAERSSSNTEYFTRGDKIPGLQVRVILISAVDHMRHRAISRSTEWTSSQLVKLSNTPADGLSRKRKALSSWNSSRIVMAVTRMYTSP